VRAGGHVGLLFNDALLFTRFVHLQDELSAYIAQPIAQKVRFLP
jgi:hypothetical protein